MGKGRGEGYQSTSVEETVNLRRLRQLEFEGQRTRKKFTEHTLNICKRLHLYLSTVYIIHKETYRSQVKNYQNATGRTQKAAASVVGKISPTLNSALVLSTKT